VSDTCTINDIHLSLEAGETDLAAGLLRDYIYNKPDDPNGWHELARYFIDIGMAPYAYPIIVAAVAKDRNWRNLMMLGATESVMQMPEQAHAHLKKALKVMPDNEPEKHRAIVYRLMSSAAVQGFDFDKAEYWAKKSLAIEDHHQAKVAYAFAKLHKREWAEGWKYYAYQLGNNEKRPKHDYGIPDWQGEDDAHLMVYGDQGLGDQIAYMSAMPKTPSQINCHPKLAKLFARSFPKSKVYGDMFKREFDWELDATHQTSMAEAMQWATMRPRGRYLESMSAKRLQWGGLLASVSARPKIGIAWTGGMTGSDGWRTRSLSLKALEPLLRLPYTFVSLEYKDHSDEIGQFERDTGIVIQDWPWGTQTDNYDDTAALVDCLDAVVCVPTTAYHLAGGLGVPACVLVHDQPHFHEGLTGPSPWWESVDFIRRSDYEHDSLAIDEVAKWLVTTLEDRRTVQDTHP
jgi:hypothetical protein